MHDIEPFYNWRNFYVASDDERSPFHERVYSETHFTERIYNHFIYLNHYTTLYIFVS